MIGKQTERPQRERETPAIELLGVTKRYGDTTALQALDLTIEEGEFLVLLGPSGCGKSTVLKLIAGLEDATEGDIYIEGRLANYAAPKARDVAMVFQNYALYPHMTVERNIGFPLKMTGHSKREVHERTAEAARFLELDTELQKYPDQLSGGQRQRVALGRALVRNPIAFLMDEPLSNLDALLRVQMRDELLRLHRRIGRTTVYVTHDQVEAMTMADRIVVMRNGVAQQIGKPRDVYNHPLNTFVAGFVGSPPMNLLAGAVETADGSTRFVAAGVEFPLEDADVIAGNATATTLGIRPEHVRLVSDSEGGAAIPGKIGLVEPLGADTFVRVVVADDIACVARVGADSITRKGERVYIRFPPEKLHLFDDSGARIERSRTDASA